MSELPGDRDFAEEIKPDKQAIWTKVRRLTRCGEYIIVSALLLLVSSWFWSMTTRGSAFVNEHIWLWFLMFGIVAIMIAYGIRLQNVAWIRAVDRTKYEDMGWLVEQMHENPGYNDTVMRELKRRLTAILGTVAPRYLLTLTRSEADKLYSLIYRPIYNSDDQYWTSRGSLGYEDAEMILAIFAALEVTPDTRAMDAVRAASQGIEHGGHWQQVTDAAQTCLQRMEAQIELNKSSARLLRPADTPPDEADLLLHPASNPGSDNDNLLHVSHGDGDPSS